MEGDSESPGREDLGVQATMMQKTREYYEHIDAVLALKNQLIDKLKVIKQNRIYLMRYRYFQDMLKDLGLAPRFFKCMGGKGRYHDPTN